MRSNLSHVVVAMVSAGVLACGGGSGPSGSSPASDAGEGGTVVTIPVEAGAPVEAAAPVDHGAPSSTFPAFPVTMGQLQDNGGYKMKSPILVAITWDSDPSQASFDAFADTLGATSYWKQTSSEWGVGPVVSGTVNHVHMTTPAPATLQDSDLQTMVSTNAVATADGGAALWPSATQDTIYAFFLPPSTSLLIQGQSGSADACGQGIGGYHDQVSVGTVTTAYAVVPSCTFPGSPNTAAQQTAMSMSHEVNEAVSDPQPQANTPGVNGFDNNSFAWTMVYLPLVQSFSVENGDACELFQSSFYEEKETSPAFDYWVQRIWSNKSAAAGHNPCVPVEATPYFNVTPLDLQDVNVNLPAQLTGSTSAQQMPSKGYKILAGSTGKFAVGFYSDAATSGPWTLSATANSPLGMGGGGAGGNFNKSAITVSLDKTSGQNGEKAWVTVNVMTTGASFKGEQVNLISTLGGATHFNTVWIAGQ